jgi:phospholipid transport system substrate-binding protein
MLAALITSTLLAAAPSPLEVVQAGSVDVQRAASTPGATVEQLATAIDAFVDFEELAMRALGKTWETLTPAQRKEFTGAMRGMLRTYYAQNMLGHGHAEVRYGQESVEGREAVVSTFVRVNGMSVRIDYKLFKPASQGRTWRIYDVVTDEVSLLENYRRQFDVLLADGGFTGLLSALKLRQAQVERAAARRTLEASRSKRQLVAAAGGADRKPRAGKRSR